MKLGETINRLRTEKGMSQGDLADALEVSRQSVSKWETENAVPELDKLVRMSRLFGVTLDELVSGERPAPPPEAASPAEREAKEKRRPGQRTAGVLLLCLSGLILLLGMFLWQIAGFLMGAVCAAPFFACAVICFVCRRNAGLWCAWAAFFGVDAFMQYIGISWRLVFLTGRWEPSIYEYNPAQKLAAAWILLGLTVLLIFVTVVRLRKKPFEATRDHLYYLIAGWALFAVIQIPLSMSGEDWSLMPFMMPRFMPLEWLRMGVLTVDLLYTVRYIRTKRAKNTAES